MLGSEYTDSFATSVLDPNLFIRYGAEVENYLEVYLRTPGLSKSDVARALLARGNARKLGGESLLAKAEQGMCRNYLSKKTTKIIIMFYTRFSNRFET